MANSREPGSDTNAKAKDSYQTAIAYLNMGDSDTALSNLTEALKYDPQYSEAHYLRGKILYDVHDYIAAISSFSSAFANDRGNTHYLYHLSRAYRENEQYVEAIDCIDRIIELTPNDEKAYYTRANIRFLEKNYRAALIDFNDAIRINPNYARAYNNRGVVHKLLGNFDAAMRDYTTAIRLEPKNLLSAYYNRAIGHHANQDQESALNDITQYILLKSSNPPDDFMGHTKIWMLACICELDAAFVKPLLLSCLDITTPLGQILWEQRGLTAPTIHNGVRKIIVEELKKLDVMIDEHDYPSPPNKIFGFFFGSKKPTEDKESIQLEPMSTYQR